MSGRLVEITNYPSSDRLRELMRNARQERAEMVAELFGFRFSVIRDVASARRNKRGVVGEVAATASGRS